MLRSLRVEGVISFEGIAIGEGNADNDDRLLPLIESGESLYCNLCVEWIANTLDDCDSNGEGEGNVDDEESVPLVEHSW